MKLITKRNEKWRKINAWSIYWLLPQNYLLLLLYKNRRMFQSRLFFSPLLNKPRILFLLLQRFHLTSTSKLKHLFFHFEPLPLVLSLNSVLRVRAMEHKLLPTFKTNVNLATELHKIYCISHSTMLK